MLAIFEKKTIDLDLYLPLNNYIVINYGGGMVEEDIHTLNQYRYDVAHAEVVSLPARRDLLQNYYKALCAVESRIPISPDKDHVNSLTFTWFDAFKNKQKAAQQNIHLGNSFKVSKCVRLSFNYCFDK